MKKNFLIICSLTVILLFNSCMFVSTKANITIKNTPNDNDYVNFKNSVKTHYDNLSKLQKISNDALDDAFLNKNITLVYDTLGKYSNKEIEIGEVTGKARIENDPWLIYKMKKTAILQGANYLIITKRYVYDNKGSLFRIITGRNRNPDYPPKVFVVYTASATFKKN